jgi:hypothetical protein
MLKTSIFASRYRNKEICSNRWGTRKLKENVSNKFYYCSIRKRNNFATM